MSKLRLGSEYIPLVEEEMSRYRVVFPFSRVAWFTVSLPFFGFIFCVVWSILYNFEHSTSTHCKVYNFLPSVSAAIGHYKPQRNVWKTVIAIQAVIRAIILVMYHRHYQENIYKWARGLSNFATLICVLENVSLVALSFWTSNENYALHKLSFITFLIASPIHMLLVWYLMNNCRAPPKDSTESKSFAWKRRWTTSSLVAIVMACYFFYRHNKYCEPFVYSMFALAEYVVVLSNMGFHSTAAWDFSGRRFLISRDGFRII